MLGEHPNTNPGSTIHPGVAVFHDRLEEELNNWPSFMSELESLLSEDVEWRDKPDDAYRQAAAGATEDPAQFLSDLLEAIINLDSHTTDAQELHALWPIPCCFRTIRSCSIRLGGMM